MIDAIKSKVIPLGLLLLILGLTVQAQDTVATQKVYGYDGSSNLVYVCESPSYQSTGRRASTFVAITAISKANPGVLTSTGHGFPTDARPQVTISGATGTGWTGFNATFTATIIDANTFSVPINSSGFSGSVGGSPVFKTTAPRTVIPEWSVSQLAYSGTNLTWSGWLYGVNTFTHKCSEAATATVFRQ